MAERIVLNGVSYHGSGAIREIPGIVKQKGWKKVFVTSDPDLIKFGVTAKVTDLLDEAGISYSVYSKIKPNPTIQNVQEGVAAFKEAEADSIIAIGGKAPCRPHDRRPDDRRHCGRGHDQLRDHRSREGAQVRLRRPG